MGASELVCAHRTKHEGIDGNGVLKINRHFSLSIFNTSFVVFFFFPTDFKFNNTHRRELIILKTGRDFFSVKKMGGIHFYASCFIKG